jgi:hypothetical protein
MPLERKAVLEEVVLFNSIFLVSLTFLSNFFGYLSSAFAAVAALIYIYLTSCAQYC